MELIRGPLNLRERHRGCVVTIGTFDGIHLGHRALLSRLSQHAARESRPAMMLTFEPMPREYLHPEQPPARLTSWRERWHLLGGCGIDYMCVLRFDERLRNLSAPDFAALLANQLHSHLIVVGHDFRFGRKGEATASALAAAGQMVGGSQEVIGSRVSGRVTWRSRGRRKRRRSRPGDR